MPGGPLRQRRDWAGVVVVTLTRARPSSSAATGSSTPCTEAWSSRQATTSGVAVTAPPTERTSTAPASTTGAARPGDRFHTIVG